MFTVNILLLISVNVLAILNSVVGQESLLNDHELDLVELLGLRKHHGETFKGQPSLKNSAAKFLLEVYNDITANETDLGESNAQGSRRKRELNEESFITELDRKGIENCNNIITFSSKNIFDIKTNFTPDIPITSDMHIGFNTNDVPCHFQLIHSALRIYQEPSLGKYVENTDIQTVTITIYEKKMYPSNYTGKLGILASVNTTTNYKGWLEFNMTQTLKRWLHQHSYYKTAHHNGILVGVTLNGSKDGHDKKPMEILASDLGLVKLGMGKEKIDLLPFLIGYFNGPELLDKVQELRFKRNIFRRKRAAEFSTHLDLFSEQTRKRRNECERLNLSVDFKDLQMDSYVIAPRRFDAYFCDGECNFPLDHHMNATSHAILQTLVHLKRADIPKAACVPTAFASLSIVYAVNNDTAILSKFAESIAKECGCQ